MKKQVRPFKQPAQFQLIQKTNETDPLLQTQLANELPQFSQQRSLPSDCEPRIWELVCKRCERAQSGGQSLLNHQSAGLNNIPRIVDRRSSRVVRKILQRNTGPIQANLYGVTLKLNQTFGNGTASYQNDRNKAQQPSQAQFKAPLGFSALNVHSMKRNDTWSIPSLDKRKQMHAGIPKIDVHEVRIAPQQYFPDRLE